MKKNIYIFTRCWWTFENFRKGLVKKIDKKKYNISVCLDLDNINLAKKRRQYSKIEFINIPFLNKERSKIKELLILYYILKIFLNKRIHIIHNFTARPVIYVTFVNFLFCRAKIINSITGLGHNFLSKKKLIATIYNIVFLISSFVIFQNKDDQNIIFSFLKKKIKSTIIFPNAKFIGIKNKKFYKSKFFFCMYSRIIQEKGVYEYVEAAKLVNKIYPKITFCLIGNPDESNPTSISYKYLNELKFLKFITYLPHQKKILKFILTSKVIVLPSYGEGLPASLLEALYLSKPIITTKVNGCKEIVKNNYNGFLVKPKSSESLAKAMTKFIKKPKIIKFFGRNSNVLYNKKFIKSDVVQYLNIYKVYE